MTDGVPAKAIDTFLLENRTFGPTVGFLRQANAEDPGVSSQASAATWDFREP